MILKAPSTRITRHMEGGVEGSATLSFRRAINHVVFLFLLLLSHRLPSVAEATVAISRGIHSSSKESAANNLSSSSTYVDANGDIIAVPGLLLPSPKKPSWCRLEEDRSILISHPQSIDKGDRFYGVGSLSLEAVTMAIDHINNERCGVQVGGENYSITLQTYGDNSNEEQHQAIAYHILNNTQTDFMIGGYSSRLTRTIAPMVQAYKKLLVTGGSSQTDVFQNRSRVFGIIPTSVNALSKVIEGLAQLSPAQTVASVTEDGVGACESLPQLTQQFGMQLVTTPTLPNSPTLEQVEKVAQNMSQIDPDVMVTCVYNSACIHWVKAMKKVRWSPRAQVFGICTGAPDVELALGEDLAYMTGSSAWDRVLPDVPDAITGWTPAQFADLFESYAYQNATYQHTAAAASISVLVHAI